ncbi:hypothetical protein [Burkholderia cepacia]|uniref:hypothetical protein n=1 Tax=Burkholderia cepacia TaxID=292 RepID=UPI003527DA4B
MTIDVRPASAGSSGPGVDIAIRDTSIGIPDDSMSTLFDVYIQTDASIYRRFGGTGLGRHGAPAPPRSRATSRRAASCPASASLPAWIVH